MLPHLEDSRRGVLALEKLVQLADILQRPDSSVELRHKLNGVKRVCARCINIPRLHVGHRCFLATV